MMSPEEQKQIFRQGWSDPNVVEHRVERFIHGEMGFEPSRRAWLNVLRRIASPAEHSHVVDMGTGPGTIAGLWAELGFKTTGVDFSPTMLAAADAQVVQRGLSIHFVEADVENPPFAEQSFDLVCSRAVLFTLPHPGYAVARWVRLLRPGGLLVLIGNIPPTDPEKLKRQHRPPKNWRPDESYRAAMDQLPFRIHTDASARVVMEAAGLSDIHSLSTNEIIDARLQHEALDPPYGVLQGTPYVLVGSQPST